MPNTTNIKYVKGNAYKGWYYFFIRYKINNTDYTQWFNFGSPIYNDVINKEIENEIYRMYSVNSFYHTPGAVTIIDLKDVTPMTFPFNCYTDFLREDDETSTISREDALRNAKDVVDNQIRLPKVVQ